MITKEDPEVQRVLQQCYLSTKVTAKVLFPDLFYGEFSPLHDQILGLIDSGAQKIAIAAPRGIGKTTIARTVVSKSILFRDTRFITYVSNSATVAEMQTENIKRELQSNDIVRRLFGDIKIADSKAAGLDDTFSKLSWVAFGSSLVLPRGAQQQIRGLLWGKHRPQLLIVDDLEKKEELRNQENREKLKEWFFSDLMKCINRYLDDWRMIYIDTLKHEDSLLQLLLESDDWEHLRLSVCDTNYNSLAPSFISTKEVNEEVESHRKKGILDVFYMEFMNMPTGGEDASFKEGNFKYYDETDDEFRKKILPRLESVVIFDPAKTVKMQSAESAIVGVGIDLQGAGIYVRDIVSERLYPDQAYDEIFQMCARLNARVLGVEVTGLHEFVTQPIRNEMLKRRTLFELVELSARKGEGEPGKIARIKQLVPYYRQGYVYHNRSCCGGLEAQLLSFPRSRLWDIMDALAYIIEMMSLGDRYFEPIADSDENQEEDYEELESEYEPILENWRVV